MLRTIFVVLIMAPGLVAALSSRFAALLLYFWFALFRPQDWMWIDITPLRLSLILSLLVVIPRGWFVSDETAGNGARGRLASEAWPNLTHPLSIGMALFLATALIAQQHAVDQAVGWEWIDFLWKLLLVSTVAISLTHSRERFWAVAVVIASAIGFHATKAGISSLLGGGVRFEAGLGGAYADSNGYALAMVMTLPFQMAVAQTTQRRWVRWLFYGSLLPTAYAVVSTFSRAGFLALAVAAVTFILLQRRRAVGLVALAAVVLVALLVVPIPRGYLDRLETIQTFEEVNETSALSRLHFWRVAVEMVRDKPLGVGLRNYDATYNQYDFSGGRFGGNRSVHSSHFQVLAENGVAGFVIWMGLFAYGAFACLRIRRRSAHAALADDERRFYFVMANTLMVSMAAFAVGGAFIALALNDLTWITFALIAALDRVSARAIAEPQTERALPAAAFGQPAPVPTPFAPPVPAAPFRGAYRHEAPGGASVRERRP